QRDSNHFVLFDLHNLRARALPRGGHENRETLTHEATHQLTFNTGLLDRQGRAPLCIIEGLGMYGEVRRLTGRPEPGGINPTRLDNLARLQRRRGSSWIPLAELLREDGYLKGDAGAEKRLLAYAQSWLLVHRQLKDPEQLPRFRSYLE